MSEPSCPKVIVIVEDEEDSRELLRQLLEEKGYAVLTASDGVAALDVLNRTSNVCLVLLDLIMPRMGGLAFLAEVAADPKLATLPICLTTSATDRAPVGVRCLRKPVDVGSLYDVAEEYCSRRSA